MCTNEAYPLLAIEQDELIALWTAGNMIALTPATIRSKTIAYWNF